MSKYCYTHKGLTIKSWPSNYKSVLARFNSFDRPGIAYWRRNKEILDREWPWSIPFKFVYLRETAMVNRCGSRSLAAAVAASAIRRRLAWGMVHGCMAGTGHGGHEGTWTLPGPLQGTDTLAVGNLSRSPWWARLSPFERYAS